jgi:hypothetical protein
MQIALTKKLADAEGIKAPFAREDENPLFSWTAQISTCQWMKSRLVL